jgi:hypothetical protein
MEAVTNFYSSNSSLLSTVAFLVVIMVILYYVYTYLYPAQDPTYTQFLRGEADARGPITLDSTKVPGIYTGGDFTFSFWVYIDDWNYKVQHYKSLFTIGSDGASPTNVLVGMLAPIKNHLLIRAAVVDGKAGAAIDITNETQRLNMVKGTGSMSVNTPTVGADSDPCNIKEIALQRWVCVTIVSSGAVLDVYMDGKLARSCVLDNVVKVPRGPLVLNLADQTPTKAAPYGGFGGRFSSVQMWAQQLTPDVIYGIYQMGPTQTQHSIFTDVAKYFNLNVSFTGSSPGQTGMTTVSSTSMYNQAVNSISNIEKNGVSGLYMDGKDSLAGFM